MRTATRAHFTVPAGLLLLAILVGSAPADQTQPVATRSDASKSRPTVVRTSAESVEEIRRSLATRRSPTNRSARWNLFGPPRRSPDRVAQVQQHDVSWQMHQNGEPEEIHGQPMMDPSLPQPMPPEAVLMPDIGPASCAEPCCGNLLCGPGPGPYFSRCLVPFPQLSWENLALFGGVQGFKGPANRGLDGSFGFHEGLNWGAPLRRAECHGIGYQLGFRATHNNFYDNAFASEVRNQQFYTGGLFHRVDHGLQWGLAIDALRDDWYFDIGLTQMRGEFSWLYPYTHEFGFEFAIGLRDDTSESIFAGAQQGVLETWDPVDQYLFFYRRRGDECVGGEGRLAAGFTGNGGGLLAADFDLPVADAWSVQAGFRFLIPKEPTNAGANTTESWNVGMGLVWYPGRTARGVPGNYYRPLFDVADNGSMMFKQL